VLIRKMELLEWCGEDDTHYISNTNISEALLCGMRVVRTALPPACITLGSSRI